MAYDAWERLRNAGVDLVPRRGLVERLRAVKDEEELTTMRETARLTDAAFGALAEERFIGRTEREVAWRLEQLFHEQGAKGPAFEIIVASGPNSALPHHRAGDRVIGPGETIVVDAAAAVDGYSSDCTRTFATGELPERLQEIYAVTHRAQQAGLEAVRAGTTGVDADGAARALIDEAGYGDWFGHGLGHGLGIEVHEAPRLSQTSDDTLAAGNVVTVEPGIYLPGEGGVRIEDLVIVTEDGPEVLTSFTKELVTVD
jgi:Xaa-Pro aminopeptidase